MKKVITVERLQEIIDSPDFRLIRQYTRGYAGIVLNRNNNLYYAYRPCKNINSDHYYWPIGLFLKGRYAKMSERR